MEIKRLELKDLSAIETIERESYPTPRSRSMFARRACQRAVDVAASTATTATTDAAVATGCRPTNLLAR